MNEGVISKECNADNMEPTDPLIFNVSFGQDMG